jgi:hypothetical protein
MFEAATAAAAAVLCIIGLSGRATMLLVAITTIVLGVALLIEGGGLVARQRHYLSFGEPRDAFQGQAERHVEHMGRTSAESIAGISGIVLGILSLFRVAPHFLLPISLIIFGAGMLMGTSMSTRGGVAGGGHGLIGVAAVVLGILALVGVSPTALILVGFLAVSFALIFSGTFLGARLLGPHHAH